MIREDIASMNPFKQRANRGTGITYSWLVLVLFGTSLLAARGATNLSVWFFPGASGWMIRQPDALGNRVLDYSGVGYLWKNRELMKG